MLEIGHFPSAGKELIQATLFFHNLHSLNFSIMSKSKSFFGLRKGSTKSHTYAVLKGQQVTKDRVVDVANPKTQSQMVQRMLFANAVKFYKHATSALFKFAFEDKKPLESDYNAFMRHNGKAAVAVSRENYNDNAYPAFGRYLLSQGSLTPSIIKWNDDSAYVKLQMGQVSGEDTIGQLSTAILLGYPALNEGDIVTIVLVHTSLRSNGEMSDERVNRWDIRQFVLDKNDTRNCSSTIGVNLEDGTSEAHIANMDGDDFDTNYAKGCAVIFSRNTPAGLKVSNSHIIGNAVAEQFIQQGLDEGTIKALATTWGATEKAILQGSLAE